MKYSHVSLSAYAHAVPDQVLTSREVEDRLGPALARFGMAPGRIEQLTGIRERRVWPLGTPASDMAVAAARQITENPQVDRDAIDLLIHCGICRDYLEPATATMIHQKLGLGKHCMPFDLTNACLGFFNGIFVAANMIELGQIRSALIVTGENSMPIYDQSIASLRNETDEQTVKHTFASLTLGSGAVAYLLQRRDLAPEGHRLIGGVSQTDSASNHLCRGWNKGDGFEMRTDTQGLLHHGLVLSKITWELFKRELEWLNETPNHIFTHQISSVYQVKVFEALQIDLRKGYTDIETLGNTGSAAAPMSLSIRAQAGKLQKRDLVALMGIGSGLNVMMLGFEW